ncbi:MAG: type II secretion system protein GspH [Gammaproteobacteria bacterium]|nr:MAG: type II secretion system protein GspH [Gammaproteobacteria bacterium]
MLNTAKHPSDFFKPRVPCARGFTLIELLVVISIISIAFTLLITLTYSFSNPTDAIKQEASRLQQLLVFAQEQSVIRGEEYGLRINEYRYRFMRLDDDKWVDIETDNLLYARELPENMRLELRIENIDVVLEEDDRDLPINPEDPNPIKPQVFLLSSGEVSPDFSIQVRLASIDNYFEIIGKANGDISLQASEQGL